MTIKTLKLIHKLLEENEAVTNADYKFALRKWEDAKDKADPNAPVYEEQKEKAADVHFEAECALEDFEAMDWH